MNNEEHLSIKISVRDLVEFVLRNGDLVSSFSGSSRNVDAIKAHQKIQKSYGNEYMSEVTVKYNIDFESVNLEIKGRIDGIFTSENGDIIIDEIKTTTNDMEFINEDYNLLHFAQAQCYAYIYAIQNNISKIVVQLTYYQLDTKEIKYLKKNFIIEELEDFFYDIINRYIYWAKTIKNWYDIRNSSINALSFPFSDYREGQRKMCVAVYGTIKESGKLFVQAPTGIGKTMASIFPSVKALGSGLTSKLFYVTAKTVTAAEVEKAYIKLINNGLRFKIAWITAKEKICFKSKVDCEPEKCEFAKGYFDRIKAAIEDIFNEDMFTRECIVKYANKHKVCPFEFSLDLALWSDCIVCDYNYVFDPRVYLRRFFQDEKGDYTLLVDEAHNLVDRAREMFSAEMLKKEILNLKKICQGEAKEVSNTLNKINSYLIKSRKKCEEVGSEAYISEEHPKDIFPLLNKFINVSEKWLLEHKNSSVKDNILDMYFKAMAFIRTAEGYDERYITYHEKIHDDLKVKMFCLDPSKLLQEALKRVKTAVFFSATLTPIEYFINVLGGVSESFRLKLESPFPKENLCLIINGTISTKYRHREDTYINVTESINSVINGKQGNYLIFFPSYQYMNEVYKRCIILSEDIQCVKQETNMSERQREDFINKFSLNNKNTLAGFVVMGGVFGEGIDLSGERLSGAVIVGVGLPKICLERELIKDYFAKNNGKGFQYAYIYPAMNKVMQAVGRVIRTEEDKGVVLLVDERFMNNDYKNLFPKEWNHYANVEKKEEINSIIKKFWQQ